MIATADVFVRRRGGFFMHGIKPARMPRMTLAQALCCHETAFPGAVFGDRLYGITGTTRVKTAILPQ
jgi:hypothetical protein